jgi:hypothetical protein
MSPLTFANYRLDGTVMRCAGGNLVSYATHNARQLCVNCALTCVNYAAQQRLPSVRIFLAIPKSVRFRTYLFREQFVPCKVLVRSV